MNVLNKQEQSKQVCSAEREKGRMKFNARTFRMGGIHPEENKLTHEVATQVAALPKQAIFPLSQHIGAPAKPVVQKGDKVKVGTMIAEPGGFVSAPICMWRL